MGTVNRQTAAGSFKQANDQSFHSSPTQELACFPIPHSDLQCNLCSTMGTTFIGPDIHNAFLREPDGDHKNRP